MSKKVRGKERASEVGGGGGAEMKREEEKGGGAWYRGNF